MKVVLNSFTNAADYLFNKHLLSAYCVTYADIDRGICTAWQAKVGPTTLKACFHVILAS